MDPFFKITGSDENLFSVHFRGIFTRHLKNIHMNLLAEECTGKYIANIFKDKREEILQAICSKPQINDSVEKHRQYMRRVENMVFELFETVSTHPDVCRAEQTRNYKYDDFVEVLFLSLICTIASMVYFFPEITNTCRPLKAGAENMEILKTCQDLFPKLINLDKSIEIMLKRHPVSFLSHVTLNLTKCYPLIQLSEITVKLLEDYAITEEEAATEQQQRNRTYFSHSQSSSARTTTLEHLQASKSEYFLNEQLKLMLGMTEPEQLVYSPVTSPVSIESSGEENNSDAGHAEN